MLSCKLSLGLWVSSAEPEFRIRCLAHMLQLSAVLAIDAKNDLVGSIRKIVIFLYRPKVMQEFRRQHLKLPLDCRTRWSSTYGIVDAVLP